MEVYTSAPPFLPPGTEAGNIGPLRCTAENHPINWAEGRALHAAEPTVIVSGKKAVAAMTCPGVPTHRKRLRPAERVETESAYIGSHPSVEAGRLCRAIATSAIPLKTAVFACARASKYGVTIKREAHKKLQKWDGVK